MDESGDARNRIRFVQNIIRPFVEYYRGSAIRLSMRFEAQSVSPQSYDRREMALAKLHFAQWVAENSPSPDVSKQMRDKFPIGETIEETNEAVSYTHLTLPTKPMMCRSRWSPYH